MTPKTLPYALLLPLTLLAASAGAAAPPVDESALQRGRYLVQAGGCNDCHTPGYMQTEGQVPTARWLTGNSIGFQGPWGTTYPVNLRLYVRDMTETQWIARVRQPMRPPMPWFNLVHLTDEDLSAMYRFIRSLGPAGEPAPAAVPPGQAVATPYFEFVPKNLPRQARASVSQPRSAQR